MKTNWVRLFRNTLASLLGLLGLYVLTVVALQFYSIYRGDMGLRPRVLTALKAAGCPNYLSRREGGINPLNVVDAFVNSDYVFADLRMDIKILESGKCLQILMASVQEGRKSNVLVFTDEKAMVLGKLLTYSKAPE